MGMSENENRFFAGFRQYRRDISFAAVMVILLAVFAPLLKALFQLSLRNDLYSHIFFGPIVSLFFMYRERKTIFSAPAYAPAEALFLTSAGWSAIRDGNCDKGEPEPERYVGLADAIGNSCLQRHICLLLRNRGMQESSFFSFCFSL